MSTIKIEFESEDNAVVTAVAALTNSLLGRKAELHDIEVVDAKEVKAETPVKTPAPRASRAKAKPEPTPEPEEEEIEELDNDDLNELDQDTAEEEESIDADDIRAVQATKVDKHREAIKAKLKEFGATGISSLDPVHFVKYHAFLTKLK